MKLCDNFAVITDETARMGTVVCRKSSGHFLGRFGVPEEVVNLGLFLPSDEFRSITGKGSVVDGGWLAK